MLYVTDKNEFILLSNKNGKVYRETISQQAIRDARKEITSIVTKLETLSKMADGQCSLSQKEINQLLNTIQEYESAGEKLVQQIAAADKIGTAYKNRLILLAAKRMIPDHQVSFDGVVVTTAKDGSKFANIAPGRTLPLRSLAKQSRVEILQSGITPKNYKGDAEYLIVHGNNETKIYRYLQNWENDEYSYQAYSDEVVSTLTKGTNGDANEIASNLSKDIMQQADNKGGFKRVTDSSATTVQFALLDASNSLRTDHLSAAVLPPKTPVTDYTGTEYYLIQDGKLFMRQQDGTYAESKFADTFPSIDVNGKTDKQLCELIQEQFLQWRIASKDHAGKTLQRYIAPAELLNRVYGGKSTPPDGAMWRVAVNEFLPDGTMVAANAGISLDKVPQNQEIPYSAQYAICQAIAAFRHAKIFHGDIKPENICVKLTCDLQFASIDDQVPTGKTILIAKNRQYLIFLGTNGMRKEVPITDLIPGYRNASKDGSTIRDEIKTVLLSHSVQTNSDLKHLIDHVVTIIDTDSCQNVEGTVPSVVYAYAFTTRTLLKLMVNEPLARIVTDEYAALVSMLSLQQNFSSAAKVTSMLTVLKLAHSSNFREVKQVLTEAHNLTQTQSLTAEQTERLNQVKTGIAGILNIATPTDQNLTNLFTTAEMIDKALNVFVQQHVQPQYHNQVVALLQSPQQYTQIMLNQAAKEAQQPLPYPTVKSYVDRSGKEIKFANIPLVDMLLLTPSISKTEDAY